MMVKLFAMLLAAMMVLTMVSAAEDVSGMCETNEELSSCNEACTKDSDCTGDSNLNCNKICKEVCGMIMKDFHTRERTCHAVLLRNIVFDRNPDKLPKF
ncbi:hypothetical protein HDE_09441 [Halotydeus destructor]|nr:hypothetical protein HDE_09441 [Halotydeus destructor]